MKKDLEIFIDSHDNSKSSIKVNDKEIQHRVTSFSASCEAGDVMKVTFNVVPIVSLLRLNNADVSYIHALDYLDNEQLNTLKQEVEDELNLREQKVE